MLRFLFKLLKYGLLLVVLALIGLRVWAFVRETQTTEDLVASSPIFATQRTLQHFYTDTAQGRMFMLGAGRRTDTTVLLAHGTAAWSGFWAPQVRMLSDAGYRAVAFDMPPFGLSERPANRDYSRAAQADRIIALARTLPAPPIIVAHSFGAAAATEAVLRDPSAFAGLVIVNGALNMQAAPEEKPLPLPLRSWMLREAAMSASATNPLATKFLLRGLLHNKAAATDDIVAVLQHPQRRKGTTSAYADWAPALLAPRHDSLSRQPASYAGLAVPVRIIWGDRDTVTPPDQAEALAAAIGQGPVHYLSEVGHIPHIEAPAAFDALLLKLLDEITP